MKFENLLPQNHCANFNQIDTKHPWVKGIQVCLNVKGNTLFQFKNLLMKNHWANFNHANLAQSTLG